MGTYTDVREVMEHCLRVLTYTDYLREDINTQEAFSLAEKVMYSLRKLSVASAVQNKRVICIAGLQGAGKTTLMRNFYGLDDTYLNSTRGRGERIPVFITEKADVTSPIAYAMKIEKEMGRYILREEIIDAEKYMEASRGGDSQMMYLEIYVPYQHTNSESISFMLLPGYEKKNDDWKAMIDFSVNSSDAAVFVFDSTSFARADNEEYLSQIEERFGKNLVYVITHSDVSPDDNAEVKETCINVLGIKSGESDRVVCVGEYSDEAERSAWIEEFKDSLEKYAYRETQYLQRNSRFLREVVKEIKDDLFKILDIIEGDSNPEIDSHVNEKLLRRFDAASKKERKRFKENLEGELKIAREESKKRLGEQFEKRPALVKIRRFFFGASTSDTEEARRITENVLKDETGKYLLDMHLVAALSNSCLKMVSENDKKGSGNPLIVSQEVGSVEHLEENAEALLALKEDMINLLANHEQEKRFVIKSKDPKKLMKMIAEFISYYYCYSSVSEDNLNQAFNAYMPSSGSVRPGKMFEDAEAAKKYAFKLLGLTGIDAAVDGNVNFVSQIANSFGVPIPVAGVVTTAVIGTGAVTSMMKDINRMELEDLASAEIAVSKIYENYLCEVMNKYDGYIEDIREQIEDRLSEHTGERRKAIIEYNAKVEIRNALDLLIGISEKLAGEENGVEATLS